ncbi:sensor histidine kinase [Dyadobacter sp. LJ53]|uniref:sensor histidine kinase n=1 Tax=Dyadobacter chenwenxiniae TaxID=2906456 RepID=UPI001F37A612|nr:sensor histidine kinase [Dyadobacter chenwenxiniae]MCF0052136.1 sensor histidine kinase [Dyadobacter chenwenxiniae]
MAKGKGIAGMSGIISPKSRWSYALTMPVFLVFFNYLMVGPGFISNWKIFTGSTLLNGFLLTITFFIQTEINNNIAQRYPRLDQTLRRILVSIAAHAALSGVFLMFIAWLYIGFGLFGSTLTVPRILTIYLVNVGAIMLVMGIQETINAIGRWKHHEVNRERLLKENVNGQLESLKAQVSPHFLFNTLNSLSTLIAEDPQKAEQFVDEMARVYRYLLQTNHASLDDSDLSQLTTLQKELSFIESYGHLLKTRYGDGMKLYVHVEKHLLNRRIPPLTLQLLVENAVKHNVIRASRPLTIFILSTQEGDLMVRNNLQKKTLTAGAENLESTGVGLVNIITKYKLLNEQQKDISQPVVESNHEFFTVILPLIA